MVKKRKWTEDQRNNFTAAMVRRKMEKRREQAEQMKAQIAAARKEAIRAQAETLKEEREDRSEGIDVSTWRSTQRPSHIYIQEAGRLRRYDLRSLEVYVPENIVL